MASGIEVDVDRELIAEFGAVGREMRGADEATIAKLGEQLGRQLARREFSKLATDGGDNGPRSHESGGLGKTLALAGLGGLFGPLPAAGAAYLGHRSARSKGQTSAGAAPTVAGAGLGGLLGPAATLTGAHLLLNRNSPNLGLLGMAAAPFLGAAGAVGGAYLGRRAGLRSARPNGNDRDDVAPRYQT